MSVSKNNSRGLGRGFASLIPVDLLDESFDPTASQDQQVSELRYIKLDQINVDPDQPRKYFDEHDLADLSLSIAEHGVMQPIIVMPFNDGYQIVAGERRFRASVMAGLDKIPALVRTLTGQHKLEVSLIENLQRKDLNIMEIATAYLKLRDQFNMTIEEIGKSVGNRSNSTINNTLRLLRLPAEVREYLARGILTEGQARPLIGLDEDIIKIVVPKIIAESWSARRVEQFIVDYKKGGIKQDADSPKKIVNQAYEKELEDIQKRLKADVKIRTNSKGAGQITIKFRNQREFERLQKLIG